MDSVRSRRKVIFLYHFRNPSYFFTPPPTFSLSSFSCGSTEPYKRSGVFVYSLDDRSRKRNLYLLIIFKEYGKLNVISFLFCSEFLSKKKPTPRYTKQAPSIICTQHAAAFSILIVVVLAAVAVAVLRAVLRTVSGAVLRIVLRTVPGAVLRAVLAVILLAVVS